MESFSIEAAYLASYSIFDSITLTVDTAYANDDQLLEGVEADLGIDQVWEADKEEIKGVAVNIVGHHEALAMSLRDRVDIDDADRSGPSCWSDFSHSTGNSTIHGFGQEDSSGVEESILKLWHTLTLRLHATPNPLARIGSVTLSRVS
jgi:hypothetical protein